MKKILLISVNLFLITSNTYAFTWSTPNSFGGYNYYSNGSMGWSSPNSFGGYNYYSNGSMGWSSPNSFGGYNYYGNLFNK